MQAPIAPNSMLYAHSDTLCRPKSSLTTVATGTKVGAAPRAEIPACSPATGPLRHELRTMQAPIAPNSMLNAHSDSLCRAASTLITVAAGTRAGAAPTARDLGSQPRHRPAAAQAEN